MTTDQKRALGIAGIVGVGGFVLYKRMRSGSGRLTSYAATPTGASGSITPFVPQAPVILQPGESLYDPNSQGLINTPTAAPVQSGSPARPHYTINVKYPKQHSVRRANRRATNRPHTGGRSVHTRGMHTHRKGP